MLEYARVFRDDFCVLASDISDKTSTQISNA